MRTNLYIDVDDETDDEDSRPASSITSSMTGAEIGASLDKVRRYLYANEKDGEYQDTQYLLSKVVVHSFAHETQVNLEDLSRGGGGTQSDKPPRYYVEEKVVAFCRFVPFFLFL